MDENPKLLNSVVSLISLYCFVFNQFYQWSKPNSTQHSAVQYVAQLKFFFSLPHSLLISNAIYRNKHSRTFQCLTYNKYISCASDKVCSVTPRLDINVYMGLVSVSRKLVSCLVKVKFRLVKNSLSINATSLWKMPFLCSGPCGVRLVCVCF